MPRIPSSSSTPPDRPDKPKGALHTTAGYLLFTAYTHKLAFDVHENDIWWCTADIGWVTGHSYVIYGPLCNGATSLMFEGVPNYPTYSRFWQIVEKYKVTQFYTAPTAIRAIAKEGNQWVEGIDLSSIRILGSVGEPLNPEAWHWYYSVIGRNQCPIVDTWWQTETGGFMILPLPGAIPIKPALATLPIMGVVPLPGGRHDRRRGQGSGRPRRPLHQAGLARLHPDDIQGSQEISRRPISNPSPATTSPATGRSATATAITGSPAASTT